jgi:transmembrane protein TMEM260 (protein O-mannosyltransferase)
VLLGYLLTLAPTVTLWDAGEFITAAKVLGIPHPPGTPLFVVLGHAWASIIPFGEYAWRLNLLSAICSAVGAGCLFLVIHRVLAGESPLVRIGGAAAAAVASAFTFTVWQNSTETEVYSVATALVAGIAWLSLRWRDARGTPRAPHLLLLILYLAALSIGNHLLALLAGPALAAFVFHTLRASPAADPAERRVEWAEWAVLSAAWVALIAVGLGSTPLLIVGGALLLGASVWSWGAPFGMGRIFPIAAVLVAAVGVSTYAYLYLRSGLDPRLDMADPDTWQALLDVIRRKQYPPRTPLDNPMFPSGEGNPGRTIQLFGQQLVNYGQYFAWQWGHRGRALEIASTVGFTLLGALGATALRRRDRPAFTLLGLVWLVTGLGLVVYMNFKAGFSLFWSQYPSMEQHEVRERDYFFIASFQVWALFAGLGLVEVVRLAATRVRWAPALFGVAIVPLALNWTAASRRGPDQYLARDFAYNMLQSVGPYGVLFVSGDNDTYPLWYAQEVEGIRQDVSVVNLSLANTDWYLRQLATMPPRPFDAAAAPAFYGTRVPEAPTRPLLDVPDTVAERLSAFRLDRDVMLQAGRARIPFRSGTVLFPADQAIIMILDRYLGRRPITYALSSGRRSWLGMEALLVQRGLVYEVHDGRADSVPGYVRGIQGLAVDTARTRLLADSVFRYRGLFEADTLVLDPAARQVATSQAAVYLELAQAAMYRRDQAGVVAALRRANHLSPNPQVAELIRRVEAEGLKSF